MMSEDIGAQRTAVERAVLEGGLSISAAVRNAALAHTGRLMAALETEVARLEQTEPFDGLAALRVAKTLRQLVPLMQLNERPAPPAPAQPTPAAPTFAQRIAAQDAATTARRNGHTPATR